MRECRVGADRDDLGIDLLELFIVVPTGRKFLDSRGGKVEDVKLDEDGFHSLKAAQPELATLSAGQFEVRSFISDLDGSGRWNCRKK